MRGGMNQGELKLDGNFRANLRDLHGILNALTKSSQVHFSSKIGHSE